MKYDIREKEYKFAEAHLSYCRHILDIACGTGTFIERFPYKSKGVDINPENVEYCRRKGLSAEVSDALDLDLCETGEFDGVHCSHLIQVFTPDQMVTCLKEISRVLKPGGILVLTTLSDFKNFYQHPENLRPYPLDAILRLFGDRAGATSPMWAGLPKFKLIKVQTRKQPLVYFRSTASPFFMRLFFRLNKIQRILGLMNPFKTDAYTAVFQKQEQ